MNNEYCGGECHGDCDVEPTPCRDPRALHDYIIDLKTALDALHIDYNDLIMCVEDKYEDETRHDTAKRYIMQFITMKNHSQQAAFRSDDETTT